MRLRLSLNLNSEKKILKILRFAKKMLKFLKNADKKNSMNAKIIEIDSIRTEIDNREREIPNTKKSFIKIKNISLKNIKSIQLFIILKIYAKLVIFQKKMDYINHNNLKVDFRNFFNAKSLGNVFDLFYYNENDFFYMKPLENYKLIPRYFFEFLINYTNTKLNNKIYNFIHIFYYLFTEFNYKKSLRFKKSIYQIQKEVKIRQSTIYEFFYKYFKDYKKSEGITFEDLEKKFFDFQSEIINKYNSDHSDYHNNNKITLEKEIDMKNFEKFEIGDKEIVAIEKYDEMLQTIDNCLQYVSDLEPEKKTITKTNILKPFENLILENKINSFEFLNVLFKTQHDLENMELKLKVNDLIFLIKYNLRNLTGIKLNEEQENTKNEIKAKKDIENKQENIQKQPEAKKEPEQEIKNQSDTVIHNQNNKIEKINEFLQLKREQFIDNSGPQKIFQFLIGRLRTNLSKN